MMDFVLVVVIDYPKVLSYYILPWLYVKEGK